LRSRGHPVRRIETSELADAISRLSGADRILLFLDSVLKGNFRASSVSVSLLEPITGRFVERRAASQTGRISHPLDFTPSDRLPGWLALNQVPAVLYGERDLRSFLTPGERDRLAARGICLVVPMCAADRVVGLLHLGPRADGSDYSPSDLQDLLAISHQAAMSLDYASARDVSDGTLRKLFLADKLATVGELAAGAAHEIRNPLTLIRGAVQLVTDEVPPHRRLLMETAVQQVDRIDAILKGLLSLSRTSKLDLTRFSVGDLINQLMVLLAQEFRNRNIDARVDISTADTVILGDRSQLQQALLNMIWNSIQAMANGGTLRVFMDEGKSSTARSGAGPPLVVRIQDSGEGIPPENCPRVFDPFFTTKEEGTGLGLSICYGIVVRHGGEITLESGVDSTNHGTTLTVILPRNGASHESGS
jgi:signal transduction histidine kinase